MRDAKKKTTKKLHNPGAIIFTKMSGSAEKENSVYAKHLYESGFNIS